LLDPAQPVLEIGIGTGLIALGLGDLGFGVVGVDLSEAMASRARQRIGPRVALGDARRLPIRDRAVAQAFSVWVLHVVGDPGAAVREAARVLRPGGRYLIVPATNHEQHGDPIGDAIARLWLAADPEGRRRDDEGRLRELAERAGLEVEQVRAWPAHDYLETPAEAIHKVETRSISVLWNVDEARWHEVVEPVLAELRAIPDPDRPIERRSTDRAVVLRKP
jgi:SAM-dependent methyltransferase